jgi:hypothetical protein
MKTELRYDAWPVKAQRNDNGFITDTPVLTRTGVFVYSNGKGGVRREYRPPEAVFAADSLSGYKGIPITSGHPGLVDSKNAKVHTVGTVLTEGRQDGDNLVADIVIHDTSLVDAGHKELSVGYLVTFDETPGVAPNGERYDAIQKSIKPNHLAIVKQGRAGNARLNMDAADAVITEETTMSMEKVRLDSGISYDAAPEVAQELNRVRQEATKARADADKEAARADAAEAEVAKLKDQAEKMREDVRKDIRARLDLEAKAVAHGITVKQDQSDRDIQVAVITAIRGDSVDLTGKSDDYVSAAYDLAIADKQVRLDTVAHQRQSTTPPPVTVIKEDGKDAAVSAADARARMIAAQRSA